MRTVTDKDANSTTPTPEPRYNPMLSLADVAEIKHSLTEMFHAYVWQCTGRSEEEHNTICFIYHGLIGILDREPAGN